MSVRITPDQGASVSNVLDTNPHVPALIVAMTEEALRSNLEKKSCRQLARALEAVPAADALAKVKSAPIVIADEMVISYRFDRSTGTSSFIIPADVTDLEAMKALNRYFRYHLPECNRDAIYAKDLAYFEDNLPPRDASEAREVTIIAVVPGTSSEVRGAQAEVLANQGLVFSDIRDQALAAAIHACTFGREDLFQSKVVRSSAVGVALRTIPTFGIRVFGSDGESAYLNVVASGSPASSVR